MLRPKIVYQNIETKFFYTDLQHKLNFEIKYLRASFTPFN